MEINTIYLDYHGVDITPSFENSLSLLQTLLNERLNSNYRKIWVEASNYRDVRFCFTAFHSNTNAGYNSFFQNFKNFRNWRSDCEIEEIGQEIVLIENFIESLRNGCLSEVII